MVSGWLGLWVVREMVSGWLGLWVVREMVSGWLGLWVVREMVSGWLGLWVVPEMVSGWLGLWVVPEMVSGWLGLWVVPEMVSGWLGLWRRLLVAAGTLGGKMEAVWASLLWTVRDPQAPTWLAGSLIRVRLTSRGPWCSTPRPTGLRPSIWDTASGRIATRRFGRGMRWRFGWTRCWCAMA